MEPLKTSFIVPQILNDRDNGLVRDYDFYNKMRPEEYEENLALWYYFKTGHNLDFNNLKTYNEKIQYLKLYDCTSLKSQLADKWLVRKYVADCIGKEYLVPLLGTWDSVDNIDFSSLPCKFVLKANHGSGWNIFVENKEKINYADVIERLNFWLSHHFAFNCGMEMHYLNINRKIIAEKYLGSNLRDYKFMCFNGKVKFLWVDINRRSCDARFRNIYDVDWNLLPVTIGYPTSAEKINPPMNFKKMLLFATKLSEKFIHVRVDFYEVKGRVFFGEMTFTPFSGVKEILPFEFNLTMGKWIDLPEKKQIPTVLPSNEY